MGLNFTLNHPHCPQQMTNALLSPALQSCRAGAASRLPLLPPTPFRPPGRGSLGPLAWGHLQVRGIPRGLCEPQGPAGRTKGNPRMWNGTVWGGRTPGACGPAGLLPSQ